MRRDSRGRPQLEYPADYLACTVDGVRWQRTTPIHDAGVYTFTVAASGRVYDVAAEGSKRFPYRVRYHGQFIGAFASLLDAASVIGREDERYAARCRLWAGTPPLAGAR